MHFSSILSRFSTLPDLARDLGLPSAMIWQWRYRDRIPASRWVALIEVGKRRGIEITLEELAIAATLPPQPISPKRPRQLLRKV